VDELSVKLIGVLTQFPAKLKSSVGISPTFTVIIRAPGITPCGLANGIEGHPKSDIMFKLTLYPLDFENVCEGIFKPSAAAGDAEFASLKSHVYL
jgi:hypothetical protein